MHMSLATISTYLNSSHAGMYLRLRIRVYGCDKLIYPNYSESERSQQSNEDHENDYKVI